MQPVDASHGNVVDFVKPSETPEDDNLTSAATEDLIAEVTASRNFISALGQITNDLAGAKSEAEIMDVVEHALACLMRATSAKDGALLVSDDTSGDLIFALAQGDTPKEDLLWRPVPKGQGIAHWVASNMRPAIVNNASTDERFYDEFDTSNGFDTRSIVAAPLINGDKVMGVVEVLNKKDGRYFTFNDQNHVTLMAHLVSRLLARLADYTS
jgi:GAF domain-containing protein